MLLDSWKHLLVRAVLACWMLKVAGADAASTINQIISDVIDDIVRTHGVGYLQHYGLCSVRSSLLGYMTLVPFGFQYAIKPVPLVGFPQRSLVLGHVRFS